MNRFLILLFATFALLGTGRAAEAPFEILDGDRVLFLGDTFLEREGTYGYLEARMLEQFPDRTFFVRNLSFAGDTPLGISRASFDPPAKGWERIREQLDLVRPTVVFLGFGMAASLQELTDKSNDSTLNADPARYGQEPMSAGRFKKELGQLIELIKGTAKNGAKPVRLVLLSPIPHEDLRATRPGLPNPAVHAALLGEYSKAIEELAKDQEARFVSAKSLTTGMIQPEATPLTDNGIHLNELGYERYAKAIFSEQLGWSSPMNPRGQAALRAAVVAKNELFFHRWRPANWTYIFGFRKGEQGRNSKEMPMFEPLIVKAEAEIEQIRKAKVPAKAVVTTPSVAVPNDPASPPVVAPLPVFTVADGYQIELWAQNPQLEKPTQMNWDALGRLWICSSSLYPQIAPGQVADDKILVLSDPNGTGKATKSEVFASGLLIPTGVVPDLEKPSISAPFAYGCYIGQSTELLHIDAAGKKRVVLSGFGTEDTHHIIHTLRWGPDGRLFMNQSIYIHSHLETPWGMVRLNSGGCLSYDPRTERTEVFTKGWVNSWGHAWDRAGQSFFTDGAGGEGINWGFPSAQFVTYEKARQIVPSVSPGNYPKFCGLELIYSPHFPADWQGNAVTNDFRAHRIVRFAITDLATGVNPRSGYITKQMPDLVRTPDVSFRPIDVKTGPDGALYVADWSNPVINHGEVDFRDPRRDHHSGRIWRISKKEAPALKWEPLLAKPISELLGKLLSDSLWERESARRVLIAAGRSNGSYHWGDAVSADKTGLREALVSAAEKADPALADALWSIARSIGFDYFRVGSVGKMFQAQTVINLAKAEDATLRAIGARRAGEWLVRPVDYLRDAGQGATLAKEIQTETLPRLIADANPRVRLESMRALARMSTARSAELILDATAKNNGDVFLNHATWLSINELAKSWTDAIASGVWKVEGREALLEIGLKAIPSEISRTTLARVLAEGKVDLSKGPWIELIGTSGGADDLRRLFEMLLVSYGTDCCPDKAVEAIKATPVNDAAALRILTALLEASRVRNLRPSGDLALTQRLVLHTKGEVRAKSIRLVGYWKPPGGLDWLETALTTGDAVNDPLFVQGAIESIRDIGGLPAIALLQKLAANGAPAPRRQQAAVAVAALDLAGSLAVIGPAISSAPNEDAALGMWRDIFKVKGAVEVVSARISSEGWGKELSKTALSAGLRAARETGKKGEKLVADLTSLAGLAEGASKTPLNYLAVAELVKKSGDAARGELVYRRATSGCVTCHAIGNAGGVVGPSMTSLGASAPLDYIVESVYAPSAKIKEGYNAATLAMKDGTEVTGIPTRETERELFVRNVAGQEVGVVKANITGKSYGASIMPAGLLDQYSEGDRLDLFAFLGELGKPGPYDASKPQVARVWRIYPGAAKDIALKGGADEGSSTVQTLVDGRLLKDYVSAAIQLVTKPGEKVWAVTQFQTATAGPLSIKLAGAKVAMLDGKAISPLAQSGGLDAGASYQAELPAGLHTIAVELEVNALPATLRASADASFTTN